MAASSSGREVSARLGAAGRGSSMPMRIWTIASENFDRMSSRVAARVAFYPVLRRVGH